jgi:hypothetical protein
MSAAVLIGDHVARAVGMRPAAGFSQPPQEAYEEIKMYGRFRVFLFEALIQAARTENRGMNAYDAEGCGLERAQSPQSADFDRVAPVEELR